MVTLRGTNAIAGNTTLYNAIYTENQGFTFSSPVPPFKLAIFRAIVANWEQIYCQAHFGLKRSSIELDNEKQFPSLGNLEYSVGVLQWDVTVGV